MVEVTVLVDGIGALLGTRRGSRKLPEKSGSAVTDRVQLVPQSYFRVTLGESVSALSAG